MSKFLAGSVSFLIAFISSELFFSKEQFNFINPITIPCFIFIILYSILSKLFSNNSPKKIQIKDLEKFKKEQFVLFLRPFKLDNTMKNYDRSVLDPSMLLKFNPLTLEEQISLTFREFNFKTIGLARNEYDNFLGIERYISDNENWQENISSLIKDSNFISMIGFGGEGFKWEIEHLFKEEYFEKLIIFYPNNYALLNKFNNEFERLIKITIPKNNSFLPNENIGGLAYFDIGNKKFNFYHFKDKGINNLKKNFVEFLESENFRINHIDKLEKAIKSDDVIKPKLSKYKFISLAIIDLLFFVTIGYFFPPFILLYLLIGFSPVNYFFGVTIRNINGSKLNSFQYLLFRFCYSITIFGLIYGYYYDIPVFPILYTAAVMWFSFRKKSIVLPHYEICKIRLFKYKNWFL